MGDGHEHEEVAAAAVEAAERPLLRGAPWSFDGVLALQRTIGNAGVSRLVAARRPKLTVARLVDS